MMNKKGVKYISSGFIYSLLFAVVVLILLASGGAFTLAKIGFYTTQIPTKFWFFIGFLFLIKLIIGKKR